jgi:hypothetical protein
LDTIPLRTDDQEDDYTPGTKPLQKATQRRTRAQSTVSPGVPHQISGILRRIRD